MESKNSIASKHENILETLLKYRGEDESLTFKLRATNRYNRLKKGYWFYGNEHYIAISFWNGMDWRNRTPNIFLCFLHNQIRLEISVSDSEKKEKFIDEKLIEPLDLEKNNYRYQVILFEGETFEDNNYINELLKFVSDEGLKKKIDLILEKQIEPLFDNGIEKISEDLFNKKLNQINERYRSVIKVLEKENKLNQIFNLPQVLNAIELKSFLGIEECVVDTIKDDSQFVFFTGVNGVGKTSILKGIYSALTLNHTVLLENGDPGHYEVAVDYSISSVINKIEFNAKDAVDNSIERKINIFSYGPFRLKTNKRTDISQTEEKLAELDKLSREETNNLFNSADSVLIDIEEGYKKWRKDGISEEVITNREVVILEVLRDVVPGFRNAFFGHYEAMSGGWVDTIYQFKESEKHKTETVNFEHIASGARSIINFIGDLMIRLFDSKEEVEDVSEMEGIVLIDEVDVHLHPKLQKQLIEVLRSTFPAIQFIVTTHSPIPLLAAKETDKVFVVQKDPSLGIICREFNDIKITHLTPNTLLTSPIFGMDSVFPSYQSDPKKIKTEKSWKDLKFNAKVKDELTKIYNEID